MIYFVRHGSTDWNEHINELGEKAPKCQGRANLDLNAKGIKQAIETAKSLKGIEFDRVICSPLDRAIQTCKILYDGNKPIEIDERVIERDFGEFEGLTRNEFPFLEFWNAFDKKEYKLAESLDQVRARVFNLLDELMKKPNENVLIVSHGGVGCILISYFKGVPADGNYISFEVPNGKPLILNCNEKQL